MRRPGAGFLYFLVLVMVREDKAFSSRYCGVLNIENKQA